MKRAKIIRIGRIESKMQMIKLKEEIDQTLRRNEKVWITGISGSGKTYLSEELKKEYKVIELDNFAKSNRDEDHQQWIVDFDKVPRHGELYEGIFDNDRTNIVKFRNKFNIGLIIVVFASVNELRKAWEEKISMQSNAFKDHFSFWAREASDEEIRLRQKQFIPQYVKGEKI